MWLAQQGWQVTAVDLSDVGLAKADQLAAVGGDVVTMVCAEPTAYTPPPNGFDLVAVVYLHLPASLRHAVYRRVTDGVALGGTMLVVGHDATNPTDGYGGSQNPDVLFTPDDVVADLADGGLLVEKAERVLRPATTEDGTRVGIDALVRARRPEEL